MSWSDSTAHACTIHLLQLGNLAGARIDREREQSPGPTDDGAFSFGSFRFSTVSLVLAICNSLEFDV